MCARIFLIVLIPSLLYAQNGLLERIKQKYEQIQSVHARLTQIYHWEGFESTQSFDGEIWLDRPDNLRLRLTNGQENHFYSRADTAWLYTPSLNQAILAHHPSEVLVDIFNFDHYGIELTENESYVLTMRPEEDNPYFEEVTLYLEKEEFLMERIVLTDVNGNRTEWLFREIEVNPQFPDTLFRFVPPSGVDVIKR
jgi:outer membrane lipoprotein carrier protein